MLLFQLSLGLSHFKKLLNVANDKSFPVAIYFELGNLLNFGNYSDKNEAVFKFLSYAISSYRDYPAYFKVDGKPLIIIYVSTMLPRETWINIFTRLRAAGLDAEYIGWGSDMADLAVFDGLHQLGSFGIPNLVESEKTWSKQIHYYPLLDDSPSTKIWMATAEPGFDDRLLPWSANRFYDRADGALYRSLFSAAMLSNPDWILIDNWNEWWENAYIEPSQLYGTQYLTFTKELSDQWKRLDYGRSQWQFPTRQSPPQSLTIYDGTFPSGSLYRRESVPDLTFVSTLSKDIGKFLNNNRY